MSDFASPTPFPRTRYTRSIHRARLAPAGVDGPKATPTPFRSTAEAMGAPTHDNLNVFFFEQEFEGSHWNILFFAVLKILFCLYLCLF